MMYRQNSALWLATLFLFATWSMDTVSASRIIFGHSPTSTKSLLKALCETPKRTDNLQSLLSTPLNLNLSMALSRRGGAMDSDDENEDEYDDEEYDDEEEDETEISADREPHTAVTALTGALNAVSKALMRALNAATKILQASNKEEEETSLLRKVVQTFKSMITAAFTPDTDEDKEQSTSSDTESKAEEVTATDLGSYLAQAYGVEDGREDAEASPVLGGSLVDALKIARANAKMLVILIPSSAPNKKKTDNQAIESFLSAEVAKVAQKKARKRGETASYVLWGAKVGSSEAILAMKRLKVKATSNKGDKRPVLLVAYPAQGVGANGVVKVAPKVLAQHHCNPPPSSSVMAQWMDELRKRYSKQYAAMQLEMREAELYKERKEGYKDSVQSDLERKVREKKEEEERLAKEKAENQRLEALEKRRAHFLESLPEEPGPKIKDAITMSVRHSDGRSDKRRFASDTPLKAVFNWVDASFKMERENVILTTMNGKQTFTWDDASEEKTLKEAKLGRMVGFRVSEKKEEEGKEETKDKEAESKKQEA